MNTFYLSKINIGFIFLSVFMLIIVMQPVGRTLLPGLDQSYGYAFNYFFENNIQIGNDIIFTYGPLGFLLGPLPIGNNILITIVAMLMFKFLFCFFSLKIIYIKKNGNITIFQWVFYLYLIFFVTVNIDIHTLLIFLPLLMSVLFFIHNHFVYLFFICLTVSFSLLIKISAGIPALLILNSIGVYYFFKSGKKWIYPVSVFLTILFFGGIWFVLYGDISGIINYIFGVIELSRGNSSAMSLTSPKNWPALIIFISLFVYYPIYTNEKETNFIYIIFVLPALAYFKYCLCRDDHLILYLQLLFYFVFILFLVLKKYNIWNFFILTAMIVSLSIFISYRPGIFYYFDQYLFIPSTDGIKIIYNRVSSEFRNLKKASVKNVSDFILDSEVLEIIGTSKIDVYPWEAAHIFANNLSWHPRPVFQSYITYTKALDEMNANFFDSSRAPKFIIWDKQHTGGEMFSIDKRYLLNDEPLTLKKILTNYSPVISRNEYILLQRTKEKLIASETLMGSAKILWNTWLPIPSLGTKYKIESTLLQAKVHIERSFLQKMKKIIYKEFEVFIIYKFESGATIKHRLVVDTACNGVWISPYLDKLFNYSPENLPRAIKFECSDFDFFNTSIFIQWNTVSFLNPVFCLKTSNKIKESELCESYLSGIRHSVDYFNDTKDYFIIKGWGFPEKENDQKTNKGFLFVKENSEKSFLFSAFDVHRPNLSASLKIFSEAVDYSGFEGVISKKQLEQGKYHIFLYLKSISGKKYLKNLNMIVEI